MSLLSDPECTEGDVRLVRGAQDRQNRGQVEFCKSSRWGLVCQDHWDSNDATVVCRQLGYNVTGNFIFHNKIIVLEKCDVK